MADTLFVRASDVAKEMGVSEAMAYKIIRKLNNELKEQGFVTVQGDLADSILKNESMELRLNRR